MIRPGCTHREGYVRPGLPIVDRHDCDYVEARNELIPQAEREAWIASGCSMGGKYDREFYAAMGRLTALRFGRLP